jgi:hypothetical protein
MDLISGLTFKQPRTDRERFQRKYALRRFSLDEYEKRAAELYKLRVGRPRSDVRASACFFFPGQPTDVVYLPLRDLSAEESVKYLVVVCFFGVVDKTLIRGYVNLKVRVCARVCACARRACALGVDPVAAVLFSGASRFASLTSVALARRCGPSASS